MAGRPVQLSLPDFRHILPGHIRQDTLTKDSLRNQFRSDLTTPISEQIDNGETQIHMFYAKKIGEKYLERYKKYFKNPVIYGQDMRHEEFLGVYPDEWCKLVKDICLER